MKKVLCIMLSVVMLVSAVPVTASAADTSKPVVTEIYAADKFVKTYKALNKLFKTCYGKNAKGKYVTKEGVTYIRYRVTNKKFKTKKKVLKYLKKYFTSSAANRIYKEHFKVINKKQYVYLFLYGYDYALVINDVYASKVKHTSGGEKATIKLLWSENGENFSRTTSKQTFVYERGKWVLKYNSFWSGDYYGWETVITPGDGA